MVTSIIGSDLQITFFETLDSTNEEARRRVLAGATGPEWIVARTQTAGRGRRGRIWTSDAGNLYATGLYRLDIDLARAAQLSFAAALAVGDVCVSVIHPEKIRFKWPNDVLINRRKVCGILLQSGQHVRGGLWLLIGVGVNLAHHPERVEWPATNLAREGGVLNVEEAVVQLANRFDHWLKRWTESGFAPIREAWLSHVHGLGEHCVIRLDNTVLKGIFTDLSVDGSLRLDLKDGSRRLISAGDVFFPSAPRAQLPSEVRYASRH